LHCDTNILRLLYTNYSAALYYLLHPAEYGFLEEDCPELPGNSSFLGIGGRKGVRPIERMSMITFTIIYNFNAHSLLYSYKRPNYIGTGGGTKEGKHILFNWLDKDKSHPGCSPSEN
jgi:hypothetical protein